VDVLRAPEGIRFARLAIPTSYQSGTAGPKPFGDATMSIAITDTDENRGADGNGLSRGGIRLPARVSETGSRRRAALIQSRPSAGWKGIPFGSSSDQALHGWTRRPWLSSNRAAAVMVQDLAAMPTAGLRLQSSGDAHLQNFGDFASPERRLVFDLNDSR
jgi:Uncharacterized protein conserved in bacteria (DUF2252)